MMPYAINAMMVNRTNRKTSKLGKGGKAAYWGYKAFQALQVCSGDFSAVAEIATELLTEGVCAGAVANPCMVGEAVEAVVNSFGGIQDFRAKVQDFGQFSAALSNQLNSDGRAQTDGRMMESSERLYSTFVECDRDGSGRVSAEEYANFCSRQGLPRSMAETTLFQADVDGKGQISFEQWAAMMAGRVGRDKSSFNCGGHHGLTEYVAVCNGLACDFCHTPIPAGSRAKGCRRCDCDACASCSGLSPSHSDRPGPPPSPPPIPPPAASTRTTAERPSAKAGLFDCQLQHGLSVSAKSRGFPVECHWCGASVPIGRPAVGCRVCETDGCMDCAAVSLSSSPDSNASGLTCHGRHGLVLMQATASGAAAFRCHFCNGSAAAGSKLYSCRICRVDACVACMWKDHRRALSTGGVFTCCRPAHHQFRTSIIVERQIRQRCDWCSGIPSHGQSMQRCDACDVDVCQACLVTLPEQQAKVARVKAAANTARMTARLDSISVNDAVGAGARADVRPEPGPGMRPLSPSPPYGRGTVSAPSQSVPATSSAAAVLAKVPSYDEIVGALAAPVAYPGTTTTATRMSTATGGGRTIRPPPSYRDFVEDVAASPPRVSGKPVASNTPSAPPMPCSIEREPPPPYGATGATMAGTDPPFRFDSVVRVIGVGDPEMEGKLHTVIGFEPSGDGRSTRDGMVVLQRRGNVIYVSSSQVYKVID